MSWDMWHVYGIGFRTDVMTLDNFRKFLNTHKESLSDYAYIEDILGVMTDSEIPDEEKLAAASEMTDAFGLCDVIAHAINKEVAEIPFTPCPICEEGEEAVIYQACYPWQMSLTERNMYSDSKVYAIINKYADELGIPAEYRGEQDLVYSG